MADRIWIDVEDLFIWARAGHGPSGIQRLEIEICRALHALPESAGRVFFVRHDPGQCLVVAPWDELEALADRICRTGAASASDHTAASRGFRASLRALTRLAVRRLVGLLPHRLQKSALALILLLRHLGASLHGIIRQTASPPGALGATAPSFEAMAAPGDVLAVLGGPWISIDYVSYIDKARRKKQLSLALLVYDLIPIRRPEWCDEQLASQFRSCMHQLLPLADTLLTISDFTARDVTAYARTAGFALRGVPTPIPLGSGFTKPAPRPAEPSRASTTLLPRPDSYVLFVSTIEARKNHTLLFRVWQRLLEDMPPQSVPTLVFAGKVGWKVTELMEQIHRSNFLDGKLLFLESPTDEELDALYDGCRFTVYPSLYEGWGLPVTESLACGRPCIISNATSLPEAGTTLARYIDPDNLDHACEVIRQTIEDRSGLRAWRHRIQTEFRPVAWRDTARAVMERLTPSDRPASRSDRQRHTTLPPPVADVRTPIRPDTLSPV